MDVDALGSGVEETEVLLHLANAGDCGLEHSLDKETLLGVHDLVVAVLQLAVDVDVLNVETCQVLEDFIIGPTLNILQQSQ